MLMLGFLLVIGFVVLVMGASWFVAEASYFARRLGISPITIGLTIVAFGTSAPELAVTIRAALAGAADVAVGNVVGSNICNILLILGVSALASPLLVKQRLLRIEIPINIGVSALLLVLGFSGQISWHWGFLLVGLGIAYTVLVGRNASAENDPEVVGEFAKEFGQVQQDSSSPWFRLLRGVAGFGGILLGADLVVDGAVGLAAALGVSEVVTGLTIVAVGTSLPELATSVVAAAKGERDIAIGNVLGSNIFNILIVLGSGVLFSGTDLRINTEMIQFDIPFMVATSVALLPVALYQFTINRFDGTIFLIFYVLYVVNLVFSNISSGNQSSHLQIAMVLGGMLVILTYLGFAATYIRKVLK